MKLDFSYIDIEMSTISPLEPDEPDEFLLKYYITAKYPEAIDNLGSYDRRTIAFV